MEYAPSLARGDLRDGHRRHLCAAGLALRPLPSLSGCFVGLAAGPTREPSNALKFLARFVILGSRYKATEEGCARSPIQHALLLRRVDPDQGIARFYSLLIERDLFGTIRLIRNWSRIGTNGQELVEVFATEIEAGQAFARVKRRRGLSR